MTNLQPLSSLVLLTLCSTLASAQPALFVSDDGINSSGNREWLVEIAPDPDLFMDTVCCGLGGSLAVELAFEFQQGEIVAVEKNAAVWPFDNPGNNPFTNTVTTGVHVGPTTLTVFVSNGSEVLGTGQPVELVRIETLGAGAQTLAYGVDASGVVGNGDSIFQAGTTIDGYRGTLTVPEPATWLLLLVAVVSACSRQAGAVS